MNLSLNLQKSWQILWQHRALWLFGAVLALVGARVIFMGPWMDQQEYDQWIKIKVSENTVIHFPGAEMTIDLTGPEGIRILTPESPSWQEFQDVVAELDREVGINLWAILIELGVILAISILLGLVMRYIAETALIRMVDEIEETGKRLSVREGLRMGMTSRAWRLFTLDLIIGVIGGAAFIVMFGLAVVPVLLAVGRNETIIITAGVGTFILLALAGLLWMAASALLSLVLQPIRRACVLEKQSLWAAVRQGARLTKDHLKETGLVWVVWMGIRLLWVPVMAVITILLIPVLVLTTLIGAALGGVPAALVAAISSLSMNGVTPLVLGALAGLPLFLVVLISPMLFLGGLVRIYLSATWTLAYRDLRALSGSIPVTMPEAQAAPEALPQD